MPKKKMLGDAADDSLVVPDAVIDVAPETIEPEVSETEVIDLMSSLVGDKLLYGKKVISCSLAGEYYKLVDCDGETFLKSASELSDILR